LSAAAAVGEMMGLAGLFINLKGEISL